MKQKFKISLAIISILILASCGSNTFVPKPRGLNYIELPSQTYKKTTDKDLLYNFEYSTHAQIIPKGNKQVVYYPKFDTKIHLTYFPINDQKDSLDSYIYTSYRLLQKHNVKADAIINDTIQTTDGRVATVFSLEGEVPSTYQFYTHDSTTNFIRGALYFETATKNDSLQPIFQFVKEDVRHLLETLEWSSSNL